MHLIQCLFFSLLTYDYNFLSLPFGMKYKVRRTALIVFFIAIAFKMGYQKKSLMPLQLYKIYFYP
jgi:hypothetical protein